MGVVTPKVLIAQLLKPNDYWQNNANKIWESLTYPNKERALLVSEESSFQGPFAREANARNRLVSSFLNETHDYIFWIDSDIVEFPPDIIQKLLKLENKHPIAPFVYIENCEENPWKWQRFFDISVFRTLRGEQFDWRDAPPARATPEINGKYKVSSVGTCVLEPSDIYLKHKIGFDPFFNTNEWIYHFEKAGCIGYHIFATDEIRIFHAFLPRYGLNFR